MSRVGSFRAPGKKMVYPKEYRRPLMVRKTITPKISSEDHLDDKFAKLSLKPSQREALRILVNPKKRTTKASTKQYKRSSANSSKDLDDKFARMHLTPSQRGPDSHALYDVYKASRFLYGRVKKAAELVKHLESHKNDEDAQSELQLAELDIEKLSCYYDDRLPIGWKYDRTTFSALFV